VGLRRRQLRHLERRMGSAGMPCPVCGIDPTQVRYIIVDEDDQADWHRESSPPCGRCGQRARIVIDWDD
jgi:hypothetical protein